MRSERAETALRDILHHINLAEQFVAGYDRDKFKADVRAVYATTRCPEIISEASRRLPDGIKARHPQIAWKQWPGRETSTGMITRMLRLILSGTQCTMPCRP